MDRFEEIKRFYQGHGDLPTSYPIDKDMDWLIADNERLRRIEDALLDPAPADIESSDEYVEYLMNVCRANPRPKEDT